MSDLPPPGWYDDPTSPGQERWWTGELWSEHTRRKLTPIEVAIHGDLRAVGDFLAHTFGMIRFAAGAIFALVLAAATTLALLALWFFRELDAAGVDFAQDDAGEVVGWGGTQTAQLAAVVFLFSLVALPAFLGTLHLLWHAAHGSRTTIGAALRFGLLAAPRFAGWVVVAILPQVAAVGLIVLTAPSDGPPNAAIVLLLMIPMVWWGVTLYLMPAAVAASQSGSNPIRVALQVQKGRWWRVFWRLALVGVMMSMALNVLVVALNAAIPDSGFGLGGAFVGLVVLSLIVLSAYLPYGSATVSIVYDVMPEQDRKLVGEAAI